MKGALILQLDPGVQAPLPRTRLTHRPPLAPLAIAVVIPFIVLLKYGWGLHPQWLRFVDAAQHWTSISAGSGLAVGDRALLSNFLAAWIAGALHLSTEHAYIAFSLALTALALSLPILLRIRNTSHDFAKLYALVCLGGSLAPVLAMWVGGYDALLVCSLAVGALSRNRWLCFAGWLLAAFTHSSATIVAAIVWCMFLVAQSRGWRSRSAWVTVGMTGASCLAGFLAIRWLTDLWGGSTDRFALWERIPFDGILQCYANAFPAIIYSALGITWFMVLLPPIRRVACTPMFLVLAIATALLMPLIAVDETRITALVLLPITLAWLDRVSLDLRPEMVQRLWRWMLLPALLLPVCVVWMGTTYWPHWL